MTNFQVKDPSIESQWRAIILFGKNSAKRCKTMYNEQSLLLK